MAVIGESKMVFSVIMPVYNTKKYVARSIKSVLDQTYDSFEFIIIDDGSTDGSGEICDLFAKEDSRISVIHKQNEGQGRARNIAIERARGDYVIFLDSDDWLVFGLLEYLEEVIQKYNHYNPELIIYSVQTRNQRDASEIIISDQDDICEDLLNKEKLWKIFLKREKIGGMVWNKCIARKILIETNVRFPEIRAREDSYFISELFRYVECSVLTNYVGYYQMIRHGSTEQKKFNADFLISINIGEHKLEYISQTFPQLYEEAYRNLILCKIECIRSIVADRKVHSFKIDLENIKTELSQDLKEIEKRGICREERKIIKTILSNSLHWKWKCFAYGVKRSKDRVKRFWYDKFF